MIIHLDDETADDFGIDNLHQIDVSAGLLGEHRHNFGFEGVTQGLRSCDGHRFDIVCRFVYFEELFTNGVQREFALLFQQHV